MQELTVHEMLLSRQKLVNVIRDIEDNQRMMQQASREDSYDAGCLVAWAVVIAGLDATRQILSKDPRLSLIFTGSDHVINLANHVLVHYRRAPIMQKSDLLASLPPGLRLTSSIASAVGIAKSGITNAPKLLPGTIKAISFVEKKTPFVAYVLNTPVLKGHLWNYKNRLTPYFKKIPGNLGSVVDTLTAFVHDGSLIVEAYEQWQRNAQQGRAYMHQVNMLTETLRNRLNEMDRKILQMVELMQSRSHVA
jgi:hypothetical protein